MKKLVLYYLFPIILLSGCHNEVNEGEILSVYDDFLSHVTELFAYHTIEEEFYYNEKYHTEEAIRTFLDPFMTEAGIDQMIDELYAEEHDRYVYQEDFQTYLKDSETGGSYYDITRQTVLNPGLRMLTDELHIEERTNEIEVTATSIPVQFYSEESMYGVSQFGQLGYPALDHLSLKLTMVKENEDYRIHSVEVQS